MVERMYPITGSKTRQREKMTNPLFSDFMQRLEVERNDTSYKQSKPTEPLVIPERIIKVKVRDEAYGKRMFNAGRYSAGARDHVATAAHKWLEQELSK